MRAAALILASLLTAAALSACSPRHETPPTPPTAPSPPAPPSPPTPPSPPEPPPFSPTPPEPPAPPSRDPVVHFSPSDYPAHERRVAALINNAESRDTSGETQQVAAQGRAQRGRCATKACIEQSYAAEEARLRKWEGSGDIR